MDIDWLAGQPHEQMKEQVERFDLGDTHLHLVANGSLLNLAGFSSGSGADLFDRYTAAMLRGVTWLFDGGTDGCARA